MVAYMPSATTDASGAFTIQCLEPGAYQLSARLGTQKSDSQPLTVSEVVQQAVRLVLPDNGGLTLRIVDNRGGAVPGVFGLVFAGPAQAGGAPQSVSFRSESDGTSKVPFGWTPGVTVQVALVTPGFPAAALSAAPDAEGTVTCAIPSGAGQLRITLPRLTQDPGDNGDLNLTVLLSDGGGMLPLNLATGMKVATQVTEPTSVTVVIESIAAGEWQLAKFADARGLLLYFSGGPPPTVLRTFPVATGSSVVVDIRQ